MVEQDTTENKSVDKSSSDGSPSALPQTATTHPEKQEEHKVKVFSQLPFIEDVIKQIPLASFQEHYRVTNQGLFVEQSRTEEILSKYSSWLKGKTQDSSDIKEEKLFRKLFGVESPQKFYLLEGKKSLCGFFVPAPIPNPPQYRVPYYLGSPNSAIDYLHPADPVFKEFEGVSTTSGKNGLEINIALKDKKVSVSLLTVKHFIKLSRNSKKIAKYYPKATESLSEAVRTFILIIKKAKVVRIEEEPLRPLRLEKEGERLTVLSRNGFYFLIYANKVTGLYHIYGKNFYYYMRDEIAFSLAKESRGRVGSFEIFQRKNRAVGSLLINGVKHVIRGEAISGFINEILDNPLFIKQPKHAKNIKFYIEQFINTIQTAQPIEVGKVSSYLKNRFKRGHRILVNDHWLFLCSNRKEVVGCLARTAKNRVGN